MAPLGSPCVWRARPLPRSAAPAVRNSPARYPTKQTQGAVHHPRSTLLAAQTQILRRRATMAAERQLSEPHHHLTSPRSASGTRSRAVSALHVRHLSPIARRCRDVSTGTYLASISGGLQELERALEVIITHDVSDFDALASASIGQRPASPQRAGVALTPRRHMFAIAAPCLYQHDFSDARHEANMGHSDSSRAEQRGASR